MLFPDYVMIQTVIRLHYLICAEQVEKTETVLYICVTCGS